MDEPTAPASMTSGDVLDALRRRWPDSEYVNIREASLDPQRQGRKLDLVVVSMWASRGREVDGVEVKVSVSDWRRELSNPAKAEQWFHHVNRFWLAAPVAVAAKIRDEIPTGWGLLACAPDAAPKVLTKADKHERRPLDWGAQVGLLRSASDAGPGALFAAEERGRSRGFNEGKAYAASHTTESYAAAELERLREKVTAFADASGINLEGRECYGVRDAAMLGRLCALFSHHLNDPNHVAEQLTRTGDTLTSTARRLAETAEALRCLTLSDEALVAAAFGQAIEATP